LPALEAKRDGKSPIDAMRFFLPAVFDSGEVEETYAFMREYTMKEAGREFTDRRIDSLQVRAGDAAKTISVGEWVHGAVVQCIFEGKDQYILLTTNSGKFGDPLIIDRAAVVRADCFDGFDVESAA